jgi:putative transposase
MGERRKDALKTCIARGQPFGSDRWVQRTVKNLDLGATIHPHGRPRKEIWQEKGTCDYRKSLIYNK